MWRVVQTMKKYIGAIVSVIILVSAVSFNLVQALSVSDVNMLQNAGIITQAQATSILHAISTGLLTQSTTPTYNSSYPSMPYAGTSASTLPFGSSFVSTSSAIFVGSNTWFPVSVANGNHVSLGNWHVDPSGNLAQDQVSELHYEAILSGSNSNDYTATAQIKFDSGNEAGLCARMDWNGNGYCLSTSWGGGNGTMISGFFNGSQNPKDIQPGNAIVMQGGIWYNLKLQVSGNAIYGKIWQDGTTEPSYWTAQGTDYNLTNGGMVGVYSYGSAIEVRNVSVGNSVSASTPSSAQNTNVNSSYPGTSYNPNVSSSYPDYNPNASSSYPGTSYPYNPNSSYNPSPVSGTPCTTPAGLLGKIAGSLVCTSTQIPSIAPVSTTSASLTVIGSPTLKLAYDSTHKESTLTSLFNLSITAGSNDLYISPGAGVIFTNNTDQSKSYGPGGTFTPNSSLNTVTNSYGSPAWVIPAGKTVKFSLTSSANPKIMFAGNYTAIIQSIYSAYNAESLSVGPNNVLGIPTKQTNSQVIVGELSPYVNSATAVSSGASSTIITINGARLQNSTPMNWGATYTNLTRTATQIRFTTKIADGSYQVLVSDSTTGASNNGIFVQVTNQGSTIPTPTPGPTVSPSARVIGSPTLKLTYDSTHKESSLAASFNVSIAAGSNNIYLYSSDSVSLTNHTDATKSYGIGVAISPSSSLNIVNGQYGQTLYMIPAGKMVQVSLTGSVNPKVMFAGNYNATMPSMGYTTDPTTSNYSMMNVPSNQSNSQTVIGELSPYINSVSAVATSTGSIIIINGVRLQNSTISNWGPKYGNLTRTATQITFITQIGDGSYPIQVIDPTTGASNYTYVTVVNQPAPVSNGTLIIAKNSAFTNQLILPRTANQEIGSFILQNQNSTTDAQLTGITVVLGGNLPLTALSNLKTSITQTPINPLASNNLSANNVIPANASLEVDIFADVGQTSANGTTSLTTTLSAASQGVTVTGNNITGQTMLIPGATQTQVGPITVSPNLVSSSPVSQYVIGGSTFPVAVYNVANSVGGSFVSEMDFTTTNNTITSVTVGGITASVVAGRAIVTGLNIAVPASLAGTNIPVSVTYNQVGPNGLSDNLSSVLTLTSVKSSAGGTAGTVSTNVPSNTMYLVASKPTVSVASPSSLMSDQSELIDVTVSADNAGDIVLNQLPLLIMLNGNKQPSIKQQQLIVKFDGNTLDPSTYTAKANITSGGTVTVAFTNGFTVARGSSHTFQVFATLTGFTGVAQSVQTKLDIPTNFKWTDVNGNVNGTGANLDGSHLTSYPSNVSTIVSAN